MGKLFVVMYHYTRDLKHSRYPEIKGLDVSLFREQIEFMKQQFNIVSMEQVIEAVERHADLPDKALLLTFDDGYVDNYTFAFPILEEFGIQGSFFIPGKTFATHQLLNVNKIHYILASADEKKLVEDVKKKMDFYNGGKKINKQMATVFSSGGMSIEDIAVGNDVLNEAIQMGVGTYLEF